MATHSRKLLQDDPEPEPWRVDAFLSHYVGWTALALGGSLAIGLGFLALVRHSARTLVGTAIGLQIALPLAAALALVLQGAAVAAIGPLFLAGLAALVFFLWREQIELVTRLVGIAGHALLESPGLIAMALGLQLGWVLLVALPLLISGLAAYMNGHLVYNDARTDGGAATTGGECVGEQGDVVACCAWQPDAWVAPYLSLVGLAFVWSTMLVFSIKVFTVAGTVGQWYFAPVAASHSGAAPARTSSSRVLTSLRHALGPSLGTLCFGSAVLTLLQYLRASLEKARREAGNNILFAILAAVLRGIYALIEFLTKFAIYYAAITGDGLMAAGRGATDLLQRNFMDAFGVWWLPPMILQNCAFVAALAWGYATWCIGYYGAHWGQLGGSGLGSAALLTALSFVAGWAILSFFCSLLLNVVDAVFLCFALDRDAAACTRLEVHAVYTCLPTVGPVVENPAGDYAYGAPVHPGAPAPPPART